MPLFNYSLIKLAGKYFKRGLCTPPFYLTYKVFCFLPVTQQVCYNSSTLLAMFLLLILIMITNPTAAELIKQATALAHASTEKALIKHIKSIRTPQQYALLLGCMYGYFEPVEKQLDSYLPNVVEDYNQRRKAGRLLDDIRSLNQPDPKQFADQLPSVTNTTEAMACFYVLEGSILGGAVIKKIIGGQAGSIPAESFSFFSGYHDKTMEVWRAFLQQFNAHIQSQEQLQQAIDAANVCFEKLRDWINAYYSRVLPA